ncbi:GON-4-like protein isoform X1 [Corythoichthys intestinalis]|uniref:GON-4-like protein isoform X1 n=1 Tax=Corythoichthys intestinalis TaxID=161448 RepID=UPI0025A640BB|nr:GON-4-like protein isoform X1 [Corythoichthys intestinalis]
MEPFWTNAVRRHEDERSESGRRFRDAPGGDAPPEESGDDDELGRLDVDLDRKSRRHNLTTRNVRDILHEVITDERVVAMMKAAIRDTRDTPMFEPKMTRSRWKTAVRGGQCADWSLSAERSSQPPQFVDIRLDAEEDSSDEEYRPLEEEDDDDDDNDDTAEESFLSDGDVNWSPKVEECGSGSQGRTVAAAAAAAPPVPTFLERLNAVEEELDRGLAYTAFSSLGMEEDKEEEEGCGALASRTRSKLPLVDVPLEQLEAELPAPDGAADEAEGEQDPHWTRWLYGLAATQHEEEADDDDDPEYNFLEDLHEPDLEDYRTDRAVQITKKEVNELLEELFLTLRDREEGPEEEEEEEREAAPQAQRTAEQRQVGRESCAAAQEQRRQALRDATNRPAPSVCVASARPRPVLRLDSAQKAQLRQQMQQHVQLLTQVHMLTRNICALKHEASVTKQYLVSGAVRPSPPPQSARAIVTGAPAAQEELRHFATRQEQVSRLSSFRARNLQEALELLEETQHATAAELPPRPPPASGRLLPAMTSATAGHAFPVLPSDVAWLLATRPVFLYPQLLPVCSLDPSRHARHQRGIFTAGEDGLIVLGLKHFEGTVQPQHLISSYLLCKSAFRLAKHIREMSGPRAPPRNVLKMFLARRSAAPQPLSCAPAEPCDRRPPVEKDPSLMPVWLKNSREIFRRTRADAPRYPRFLPRGCHLKLYPSRLQKPSHGPGPSHRRLFTLAYNASLHPICPAGAQTDSLLSSGSFLCFGEGAAVGPTPPPPARVAAPRESPSEHVGTAVRDEEERDGEEGERARGDEPRREEDERAGSEEGRGGEEERAGGDEGRGREEERAGEEEEEQGEDEKDEEEEEDDDEDFDELTQDEDEEEEEASSASEESLPAVPELPATSKRPAPERRPDGESEEERSPASEEEDVEAPKGDAGAVGKAAASEDEDVANAREEDGLRRPPRGGAGRGRGRRGPGDGAARRRARRERPGKGRGQAGPVYDRDALENDPRRQSKDAAFAHGYLHRVREALRDTPEKLEEFIHALNELERPDGPEVTGVFRKLRRILGKRTELARDFAAFLHPEQALECGLFEEQQAFERGRRFLRRLEVTFGDNPSHYNKIIKALQPGPRLGAAAVAEVTSVGRSLSPPAPLVTRASRAQLQTQMAALLKGHPHLQAEFWVFFDELRPPPARPGQFEEARWPEEGEGAEGPGLPAGGFEEVALPDDAGEADASSVRRQRRKLRSRAAEGSDWRRRPESRPHRRRGRARFRGDKASGGAAGVSESADPLYVCAAPDVSTRRRSADDDETDSPPPKRKRDEEVPSAEPPVCAKNISLTPSGEKVILWTREADRVILTTCRREGANPDTFQGISALLGNKTPGEVSQRFQDLMRLFQSAARHAGSEDEPPLEEQR